MNVARSNYKQNGDDVETMAGVIQDILNVT